MTFRSIRLGSTLCTLCVGLTLAVPAAFSQTLTITGGQGQLVGPSSQTSQPLTVLLLNTNGQPMVGQPVTFTALDYAGGYVPSYAQTVYTDTTGTATSYYVGASLAPGQAPSYDSGTVIASYNGIANATFYVTTSNINSLGGSLVSANFSLLTAGQNYIGQAGSTSSTPIQIQVQAQTNLGVASASVQNVAISLLVDPSSTGSISCREGAYALTNASGIATCTPYFGKVGSGTFTVSVGGAFNSQAPIPFTVSVGPPALIQITSGNNQSGTPGQMLPLPIVGVVTDLGGNPTPNIPMTFSSVTPGGATFTNVRTVTDSAGKVSASVILGSVPGNISIKLADNAGLISSPALFTETVNLSITSISKNSGDSQTSALNSTFSMPLVVTVATSAGPVTGTPVTFSVTSGSATLGTPTATTNAQGQASTTVTAGGTPGALTITATTGQFSTTFNLTVITPGPTNLSFVNAASGAVNAMSPGSIVTIYGSGLAAGLQGVVSAFAVGPLPLSMAGVTVQLGGQYYAPIFDIGNVGGSQFLTIQIPEEVPVGSINMTITLGNGGTTTVPVAISAASPGLFTYAGANNQQYLVAIKSNGTVAGPSNPATRGETITIYLTGMALTPGIQTNAFQPSNATAAPVYPLVLGVGNQGTAVTSVAYAQSMVGVETISFVVPTTLNPGPQQVAVGLTTPAGSVYSQGATLNIQ